MKPLKYTPLYPTVQSLTDQFVERNGWQVPDQFSDPETEIASAHHSVAIADLSANGKINLEGQQAETLLQSLWDIPLLNIGRGLELADKQIYRLRADRYFISTPPGAEEETAQALTSAAQAVDGLLTITDMTHGRSELWLVGPAGRELLSRLCGLDLHVSVFPNLTVKSSSVAKTTQFIIRRDVGDLLAYVLIGAASLGPYVWQTIIEAGSDLGLSPIGAAALDSLVGGE